MREQERLLEEAAEAAAAFANGTETTTRKLERAFNRYHNSISGLVRKGYEDMTSLRNITAKCVAIHAIAHVKGPDYMQRMARLDAALEKIAEQRTAEALVFWNDKGEWATVVTDGVHHAAFGARGRIICSTLAKAIAAVESKGYRISTEEGWQ